MNEPMLETSMLTPLWPPWRSSIVACRELGGEDCTRESEVLVLREPAGVGILGMGMVAAAYIGQRVQSQVRSRATPGRQPPGPAPAVVSTEQDKVILGVHPCLHSFQDPGMLIGWPGDCPSPPGVV